MATPVGGGVTLWRMDLLEVIEQGARDPALIGVKAQLVDVPALTVDVELSGPGAWSAQLPASLITADLFPPAVRRVRIWRDARLVCAGPIWWARVTTRGGAEVLELGGPDDNGSLAARVVFPDPGKVPEQWTKSHDVRTGKASTVLAGYVNSNAGPGARGDRIMPGFKFAADPQVGASATWRGRLQNLLEWAQRIGLLGGVVWHVIDGRLTVWQPQSSGVVLTPDRGTLPGVMWERAAPPITNLIMGGQGEGVARDFIARANGSAWGRFEQFQDRRDIPSTAELGDIAELQLAAPELNPVGIDRLEIDTAPGEGLWERFELGDLVQVRLPLGDLVEVPAFAARVSVQAGVETIQPVLGYGGAVTDGMRALRDAMRATLRRLTGLEAA